jgi:DNA-binding NarL/FixJ family response regulator
VEELSFWSANMKILIVEDHGLVREGLVLQVRALDPTFAVYSSGDLDDAHKKIAEHSPEIIFLDVGFRGDSTAGLRFLDDLKEAECESRIIMLSGSDDPHTVGAAIGSGAVGFITKNSDDLSSMRRAMQMVIQGGVFISEEIRRGRSPPPPPPPGEDAPVYLRTVGPEDINVTTPRHYEALWHLYNGVKGYKRIASAMKISEGVAEEYAREGFTKMGVRGKDQFFLKLMHNGWKLSAPPGARS